MCIALYKYMYKIYMKKKIKCKLISQANRG